MAEKESIATMLQGSFTKVSDGMYKIVTGTVAGAPPEGVKVTNTSTEPIPVNAISSTQSTHIAYSGRKSPTVASELVNLGIDIGPGVYDCSVYAAVVSDDATAKMADIDNMVIFDGTTKIADIITPVTGTSASGPYHWRMRLTEGGHRLSVRAKGAASAVTIFYCVAINATKMDDL